MSKKLTVALLQMHAAGNDQEKNKMAADKYCREAAEKGADIALFPEMFNIGYTGISGSGEDAVKNWQDQAVSPDGEWVGYFRNLARELNMAIGCTYLERKENRAPANTVSLIDRHGEILFTYTKMHTCDFADFEASCTPGEEFFTAELDTVKGPVKTGAMICYDREFPESARMLMLKGAEIVLTPNACPLDDLRYAQFRTRAYENSMAMFMTNYPGELLNGGSVAFGADGSPLVKADGTPSVVLAEVDLEGLRDFRAKSIWGNTFRRPHRYGSLLDMEVESVFVRSNGFGETFDRSQR
ncbi:MAG: carbon-nitrogen hydrolase family protein [Spirochaetales bacterium]|nr:carbon-nitrogen hydrolase family protein [Spirochaetales bacterium]